MLSIIVAGFQVMVERISIDSNYDGLKISLVVVRPEGNPKAVLQIAHGMCGSKERYMAFMEFMSMNGVACIANDHRGHGESVKSDRDLGYMYDGGSVALVDDMRLVSEYAHVLFPDSPLFLLGHSMGSMAARACVRQDDSCYVGLVLCGSPAYVPSSPKIGRMLSFFCSCGLGHIRPKLASKVISLWYNRNFSSEGPQAWTCSDSEVRKAFLADPKHNFIFTFNGSNCLMELMGEAYSPKGWAVSSPCMPVLLLSGEDDSFMGGQAGLTNAAAVMRNAGYRNIRIKTYHGMRHEILNEIGKGEVWHDILEFIDAEV